jgi:hypothetical protein
VHVTVDTIRAEIDRVKASARNPVRIELTPAAWAELRKDPLFAVVKSDPPRRLRLHGLPVRVWDFDTPCRIVAA